MTDRTSQPQPGLTGRAKDFRIVGGIAIVVLLGLSLLLLAVDPQEVTKTIDRAVLLDDEPGPDAGAPGASDAANPDAPRA